VKAGEYGANTWCIYVYGVQVYINGKLISIETISGAGRRGIKKNAGEGEFKYDILDIF
jgi:hypothetical protein